MLLKGYSLSGRTLKKIHWYELLPRVLNLKKNRNEKNRIEKIDF